MVLAAQALASETPPPSVEESRWGFELGPLVTIPPATGYRFGGDYSRFTFALPWSVQFGPLLRGDAGEGLRPFRALLEPGLALPASGGKTSYFIRGGVRRVWNTTGIWGFGLGAGYTQALSTQIHSALSPEALLTIGRCCSPGFFTVSVRYEYAFSQASDELWTSVTVALW